MKKVLILGAGLVVRPIVRYLLDHGFGVTMASRTVSKTEAVLEGHPNGRGVAWTVDDTEGLADLVAGHDLSVSLLPAAHHVMVARECLAHGRPMVTTSYVSPAMAALDAEAKKKNLMLLNEVGVDPGIDHMSAMKIIDDVRGAGGRIVSFKSYCGGLPAPEANDNPMGYKFSWSPRGVLVAGTNSAKYLQDGREVNTPNARLFQDTHILTVPGLGDFEAYPNRDSLGYIAVYGLEGIRTMYRGTLRYPGWCETLSVIVKLGILDQTQDLSLKGKTWSDLWQKLTKGAEPSRVGAARFFGLDEKHHVLDRLEWLGLWSRDPLPAGVPAPLDWLSDRMLSLMPYKPGERDMLVMHHEFAAEYPNGRKERVTSSMIDFGVPNGDSSMARTVSLPAAIAVRLILEGRIDLTGVHIPVVKDIYQPVLAELETLGITCREAKHPL